MYIVANSISLKKSEAIKIIFIRVDSLTRKTFGLEIILGRGLMQVLLLHRSILGNAPRTFYLPIAIAKGRIIVNFCQEVRSD